LGGGDKTKISHGARESHRLRDDTRHNNNSYNNSQSSPSIIISIRGIIFSAVSIDYRLLGFMTERYKLTGQQTNDPQIENETMKPKKKKEKKYFFLFFISNQELSYTDGKKERKKERKKKKMCI
jgi:hypothetical protein